MPQVLPRYKLPRAYCLEIGRFVTRFSTLEMLLHSCHAMLLNLPPKVARLAIRVPRAEESMILLMDLMQLRGIPIPKSFSQIKTAMKMLEQRRDQFAHGIFLKQGSIPTLWITRGKQAKMHPTSRKVTLEELRTHVRVCDAAIKLIRYAHHEIEIAIRAASSGKSRKRTPLGHFHGHTDQG